MSEWRRMETLPREGTVALIWKEGWPAAPVARWQAVDAVDGHFMAWVFDPDVPIPGAVDDGCLGWKEDIEAGAMPTFWLPLPQASAAEAAKAAE